MDHKSSSYPRWIIFLSIVGVLLSFYSFLHKQGFTSGAFCNLNATFNCDVVNQGPYSQMFGIPVALIGIIGYLLLAFGAGLKIKNPEDNSLSFFLFFASFGGFLFALYLSGLEAFVLHAWCIVCLTSQGLITALLVLTFLNMLGEKRKN
ncbi:vitamin K epoxide reductase family protein [Candidatus Uhrbacteria bacterium]|nr:vitamin K epoxide reductase family protein [Candidatus Uhrbacteria bacterium]